MDTNSTSATVGVTILLIPFVTIINIILTFAGCVLAFIFIRKFSTKLESACHSIKNKVKRFGKEVKTEADRLRSNEEN